MKRNALLAVGVLLPTVLLTVFLSIADSGEKRPATKKEDTRQSAEPPFGIADRTAWTTSRIVGTPEPPPPYRTVQVFPKLSFTKPTVITSAPGTDRLFVAEQGSKIFSFPNDQTCEKADLFIDLAAEFGHLTPNDDAKGPGAVYGLTFHPNFAENRYCYVCYTLTRKTSGDQLANGTRVVRFTVSKTDPPQCDPKSEQLVIDWLGGGHNGGCIKFGPDGCLYISSGDGGFAFPPDGRNSGQDTSNLLSAVMRIDVDHAVKDRNYTIPKDNPLVDMKGSRGEIWAYGMRNPWKMSFDRATGDLWVGDVGWELWELVYRVEKGGNYGWSIMEGRQPVHVERERGPTPILPPTVEIPHTDGASITGGFVYRGKKLKDLVGTYIFGDWETRRIWGVQWDGKKATPKRDLVEPTVRLVAFAEDNDGELYLMDYDTGTIHQFEVNKTTGDYKNFPRKLSQTGLFASVEKQIPAPGVIPFSVNVEQWSDFATAERFIALPGRSSIQLHDKAVRVSGSMFSRKTDYPVGSVLAKTLSLETQRGVSTSRRRLETQILHFDGATWRGYSYRWNDEQTDAELIGAAGADHTYTVIDPQAPGGKRNQNWHFAGRAECTRCHNPWAEHTLAFNLPQLDKQHDFGQVQDNQLRTLKHLGVILDPKRGVASKTPKQEQPLTDPYDASADLNGRVRSYLHVNCGHCHRFNGGGAAYILLDRDKSVKETKTVGNRPTQGTFGIHDAEIIAPGDPFKSVLYYRVTTAGRGRMPHIGSELVDPVGSRLIHDWIKQLSPHTDDADVLKTLMELDEAEKRVDGQAAAVARSRQKQRIQAVEQLLSSTSGALMLSHAVKSGKLSPVIRDIAAVAAAAHPQPPVRELFEQFLPDEKKTKRLGSVVKPEQLLKLTGDESRGKELFFNTAGIQCINCHRIGKVGKEIGPELTQVGKKYGRAELLENILEPSKKIDPKFATYLLETADGRVLTGLLVERTEKQVVLRDAQNKEIKVAVDDIEELLPQRRSLMPELLLRDMTAEQVADLLAYLSSLK